MSINQRIARIAQEVDDIKEYYRSNIIFKYIINANSIFFFLFGIMFFILNYEILSFVSLSLGVVNSFTIIYSRR